MKRMLRILSVALVVAVMLIASVIGASAAEADYVINDAANAESVLAEALEDAKTKDVIVELNADWVLSENVKIGSVDEIPENKITVTGTGSINLAGKLLVICGNVVYDGLELSGNDATEPNAFFAPNGASITVKNVRDGEKRANVVGSKLVIESGTFNVVAGNIKNSGYSIAGSDITVKGGTIAKVLGGSYNYNKALTENGDAITGEANVVIGTEGAATGPEIVDLIGGSWYAASTYKGGTVTIYSGKITDLVVCGVGYMSDAAITLNALYTANWNGGTISGRWCAGSAINNHTEAQKLNMNAVINVNTNTSTTGFATMADRTTASSKVSFNAQGSVIVNVAAGKTTGNIYCGSYMQAAGCTSDVDVTLNVTKGATIGALYGSSNMGQANCSESGNTIINLGVGEGTAVTTIKGDVYLGAYAGANATGSTLEGKTTFVANYINTATNSKTIYAGSNNRAKANSGASGCVDERDIDCTINNGTLYRAFLGSYVGDGTTAEACKRTSHAKVEIKNSTFSNDLFCGSYLGGRYAKDHGTLTAIITDTQVAGKFVGGCHFKHAYVEQAGVRKIDLTRVEVTGEFYGAGIFIDYGSSASTPSKRVGTTTLNIKDVTTKNQVTLFGSKANANYLRDEGSIIVTVDGFTTTAASSVYCGGYNNRNNNDCANMFLGDLTVELKKVDAADTYWLGIGGYNKGTLTVGTATDPIKTTLIVDKATVTSLSNIKIASKSSSFYTTSEYVIKENGKAYAKTTNTYATLAAALDAVNAKIITVSENDFSIVGTSIRTGNLAMRCRVKVSKNNTLNIKRMGILVGLDNTTPFEFDILTNKPAQNNVKDANSADAQNGMITNDKDYPNHNLFAAAITGYEESGVLNSDRAKTNVYFRGYIVVEDGGFTKVIYTTPEGPDVNYGKSLVQTAAQLKGGEWYAALVPANKTKVDELAALYTA